MAGGTSKDTDAWDEVTDEQRKRLEFAHSAEVAEILTPHYDTKWGDLGHSKKIDDLPAAKLVRLAELMPDWQFERRMNNSPTFRDMVEGAKKCPTITFGGWHGLPDIMLERIVLDSFELPLDDATDELLLPLWQRPPDDGGIFEFVGPDGHATDDYGPDYHMLQRVHEYVDIARGRRRLFGDQPGPLGERIRLWAWWD
jgi:hypothetical protein